MIQLHFASKHLTRKRSLHLPVQSGVAGLCGRSLRPSHFLEQKLLRTAAAVWGAELPRSNTGVSAPAGVSGPVVRSLRPRQDF